MQQTRDQFMDNQLRFSYQDSGKKHALWCVIISVLVTFRKCDHFKCSINFNIKQKKWEEVGYKKLSAMLSLIFDSGL
jgi:hypothetical protein